MRRPVLLVGVAGLGLGLAAEVVAFGWDDPGDWIPDLVTGWTLLGCGMIAWTHRPQYRGGPLLAAAGITWFFGNFAAVDGVMGLIAGQSIYLHRGPLFHVLIAYPAAQPRSRLAGAAIIASYGVAMVPAVWSNEAATIALAGLLVAVTAVGNLRSVGPERRAGRVAVRAAVGLAAVLVAASVARLIASGPEVEGVALLAYEAVLCAVAISLTSGLVSASWERAAVTDLVVELGETRSRTLREQLARALGDPSLEIGYWLPEAQVFTDADGRELTVPPPDSGRATTFVEREDEPVAVLIHDQAVLGDPGLVDALASAARLEASNARLRAAVRARVAELEASRRRLLDAGDDERRRLERRLREGAEHRLGDLDAVLAGSLASSEGARTRKRIARAQVQLTEVLDDLDRLGRGLHPRALAEQGLESALTGVAEAFPIPVRISMPPERLPFDIELIAYFVCSEALANAAKHASASSMTIRVGIADGRATIEAMDDGRGGADLAGGAGLRNLADRVEAFGGTLTVESAAGHGTHLAAEIPLGGEAV
jgi:signal transduction histidine kinase